MLEPKYRVLTPFLFNPSAEKYAKEIEDDAEVNHERALHYLGLLSKERILRRQTKGKQVFFSINNENESAVKLLSLLEFERKADFLRATPYGPMVHRLIQTLKAASNGTIAFALLYGSAARKQATPSSDVDLLIVTNKDGKANERLQAKVKLLEREFNYAISPSVISLSELSRNWHKQPIYKSVWNDRVVLLGEERFWEFVLSEGEPK
ncbi:MAG: nucleotidyltransferase domain-containing protein [Candidatus Micrarchaeota archaeon]